MTAAVYRNTPSLSVPRTQNTAPVLEFNCLYTQDVRKKQKKWQDGILRYHTFNKRVMVYDVPRSFVGDMHWTGNEDVQEGDELTLERCGVKVEVADCIGHTETDLSELRMSKNKEKSAVSEASAAGAARTPRARLEGSETSHPVGNTRLKHRSLNALLGTPKGPIGKAALPTRSPYEERNQDVENEEWENGRPPKRPKTASTPVDNAVRTSKPSSPAKHKEMPMWTRTCDSAQRKKEAAFPPGQQRLKTKEVIELSDDDEQPNSFLTGLSDELLAPSSPPKLNAPTDKSGAKSSSPALRTHRAQPSKTVPAPERSHIDIRATLPSLREDIAPKRAGLSSRETVRQQGPVTASKGATEHSSRRSTSPPPPRPANGKVRQTLRLGATGTRKRTLVCQDQLSKKPKRISSTNSDAAAETVVDVAEPHEAAKPLMSAREKLKARLAKIDQKGSSASISRLQPGPKKTPVQQAAIADVTREETLCLSDDEVFSASRPQTSHEASAIELAKLDQLMLPPAAPTVQRPVIAPAKCPSPKPTLPQRLSPAPQPSSPPKGDRPFQRVASESGVVRPTSLAKRNPGAPTHYPHSPIKRPRESTLTSKNGNELPNPNGEQQPAIPTSKASRKKSPQHQPVTLNVTSNGTSAVMLTRPFQAPGKPKPPKQLEKAPLDLGPWSREAFDLFTWRPPGWDEESWCPT